MWARITREPLDPAELMDRVSGPENGAVLLFAGVVRNHAEGRAVTGMGYEAYEPMARDVLHRIVREAETRHEVSAVAAEHRVGELELEEASVLIAVASAHREPAYAASRFVIEEIKRRLPVWKHEHFTDGSSQWVKGTPLAPSEPATASADEGGDA